MSKLENIRTMLQNILAQFERVSTDKGLLESTDDEIKIGSPVHGIDEEGNPYDLENGEYKTSDNITYVVNDGKVDDIIEGEIEETTGDDVEPENEQNFSLIHRMAVKFESFLEKEDKIRMALREKGIEGWLIDAGEEYAIVGVWQEATMADKYFKYALTWDEDGNVVIGDSIEVKPAYVPVEDEKPAAEEAPVEENFEDEKPEEEEKHEDAPASDPEPQEFAEEESEEDKDETIKNLESEVARLEEENGALKERIAELEDKSAAEPAAEEFEKVNKLSKTGNRRMDNLNRILNA